MAENHPNINATSIAECVTQFRAAKPHVHCITNSVAQHFTANVLLAAGATPSMTIATEEVADFVEMADALLINLGTMDEARKLAIARAVDAANKLKKPWALDPVFVHASPLRLRGAQEVLQHAPSLIRCNRKEAEALFETKMASSDLIETAKQYETVIALTGEADVVVSAQHSVCLSHGSAQMDRITAMGCALTALMIGFLAVEKNRLLAAASALALFGLAGEYAEADSRGPGSFVAPFLDSLANLTAEEIKNGVRIS